MRKQFFLPIALFFVFVSTYSCKSTQQSNSQLSASAAKFEVYPIGFYNLENLYYPLSTDSLRDKEFSPTGSNNWTMEKYGKKLLNMSFALNEIAKEFGGLAAVGIPKLVIEKYWKI